MMLNDDQLNGLVRLRIGAKPQVTRLCQLKLLIRRFRVRFPGDPRV